LNFEGIQLKSPHEILALEVPVAPDASVSAIPELKYYLNDHTMLGVVGSLTMYKVAEPITGGTRHGNYTVHEAFDRLEMLPPSTVTKKMSHIIYHYGALTINVNTLHGFVEDSLRKLKCAISVMDCESLGMLVYINKQDFKSMPVMVFTDTHGEVHTPVLHRFKQLGQAQGSLKTSLIAVHNFTENMITDIDFCYAPQGDTYSFPQVLESLQKLSAVDLQHLKAQIEFTKPGKRSEFEQGLSM
jgi:hypothetical protein